MMFHDPDAPLFDADDPWEDFELKTTDHRRLEVSYHRDTGEHVTVERPTASRSPTPGRQ